MSGIGYALLPSLLRWGSLDILDNYLIACFQIRLDFISFLYATRRLDTIPPCLAVRAPNIFTYQKT